MADYRSINRANWDERAPAHAASPGYAIERFVTDPEFISNVVRFDVPLLGDITGLRGVHLQCHIGTDTISLSRLDATMTGLDFSPAAVAEAREDGILALEHPYFERPEPLVWDEPGTYVETTHEFTNTVTHEWNHGIGEIFTALTEAGLEVTNLVEHDSVPWEALPGLMTKVHLDEWQLTDRPWRLAHTYTLQARKRG